MTMSPSDRAGAAAHLWPILFLFSVFFLRWNRFPPSSISLMRNDRIYIHHVGLWPQLLLIAASGSDETFGKDTFVIREKCKFMPSKSNLTVMSNLVFTQSTFNALPGSILLKCPHTFIKPVHCASVWFLMEDRCSLLGPHAEVLSYLCCTHFFLAQVSHTYTHAFSQTPSDGPVSIQCA